MGTIALILCFGVVIWVLLWSTLQKGGQTPPGPTGLPVLGYLPFMGSRPHLLLQKLAKIYGSIFRTRTDIVLDGYFIPKESLMIANTWSILHDVECWGDDADAYNPERFLNQKGNLKAECLLSLFTGKNLQLNRNIVQPDMLRNFLSILHKFNISLFDGKSSDMEGELFMRLVPKEQELILTIRN
ncbi:cytochrome P450 1A5-like [Argiope bruennichi]|uniref:cytochrome P450 1A5-like n=1 Tax=Argiope bruennichi TaxID=94029 RepID=UPI002494F89D|nr:cytochrome P450 1A5-like [Argiope bruennichi]